MVIWCVYSWWGNWAGALVFYIEHIISNVNIWTYFSGLVLLRRALSDSDGDFGLISFVGYTVGAGILYWLEYKNGTDAIRYVDNSYYADPHLLPSVFYWLGIAKHQTYQEKRFLFDDDVGETPDTPWGIEGSIPLDGGMDEDTPIDEFLTVDF